MRFLIIALFTLINTPFVNATDPECEGALTTPQLIYANGTAKTDTGEGFIGEGEKLRAISIFNAKFERKLDRIYTQTREDLYMATAIGVRMAILTDVNGVAWTDTLRGLIRNKEIRAKIPRPIRNIDEARALLVEDFHATVGPTINGFRAYPNPGNGLLVRANEDGSLQEVDFGKLKPGRYRLSVELEKDGMVRRRSVLLTLTAQPNPDARHLP
jgi:hypothetical protein